MKMGKVKIILPVVLALLVTAGLAWFYFFYPTVEVEITPESRIVEEEIVLSSAEDLEETDRGQGILPLREFEVTLTDEGSVRTTGEDSTGVTRAEGKVKFVNEREESVVIPAGTVLRNVENIAFETVEEIEVPGVEVEYLMDVAVGKESGQAEVGIRALEKGSAGNVSTGTIKRMEEKLEGISVINPEPTRGGENSEIAVVSKSDIESLEQNLEEKVRSGLMTRIYRRLGGNYQIIEDDISYSELEFDIGAETGEQAEKVSGTATLVASGYLVPAKDLNSLTYDKLREVSGDNYNLRGREFSIEKIGLAENDNELYNVLMNVKVPVMDKIDESDLSSSLAGLDRKEAREYLEGRNDIRDFSLQGSGQALPGLSFAIRVNTMEPEAREVFQIYE
ncbi:MAG: baseplate J/gp47 family protein [Halanaerobiaceae bacterium]